MLRCKEKEVEIMAIKLVKTPKKLHPKCWPGYAFGYRVGNIDFVVMASSRVNLRKAYQRMDAIRPIDMKEVRKAIIVGVK